MGNSEILTKRSGHREAARPELHSGLLLAVILAFAILLRVAVALYLGDVVDALPLLTDQLSYHGLGARLAAGYGFSFDRSWYPFTPTGAPTAHWSFLYSLYVVGVRALLGAHPLAARLVDPLDVQAIAETMAAMLRTRSLREEYAERGLQHSRQFSWRRTAEHSLGVCRRAADQATF